MNLQEILARHKQWLNGECDYQSDLRGADLRGADLRDADLRDADLRDADLRDADLRDANLRFADLRDANLIRADLRGANLRFADLSRANLSGAELSGANLSGADLSRANLSGTKTKLFNAGEWTAIIMPDEISIGCQRHGAARWREFSDKEIAPMHKNALAWWRENKSLVMAIHASLEMEP